jgi:hypothetical protein
MKKTSKKPTRKSTTTATKKATKGSTTPASKKNSKEMNAQLQKKCTVIKGLLVTSDTDTLKARCEIGSHVLQVRDDGNKYGKNGVKQLAAALDRDADSLYDYAAVASLVKEEPFSKLVRERSKHELPLTFSHWVVLAKADEKNREDLARKALQEGWSVRTLKQKADPEEKGAPPDGVTRLSTVLSSTKSKLDENIDAVVAELSADDVSAERLADGRKLVALLGVLRDAAATGIEELQQVLESASTTRENAAASSPSPSDSERHLTGRDTSTPAIEALHAS